MTTEGERLATVEAVLLELRADVGDLKQEQLNTRNRLHKLEGISALFMETQRENRRKEAEQYKRLTSHLQVIALVITVLLFLEPFIYHFVVGP